MKSNTVVRIMKPCKKKNARKKKNRHLFFTFPFCFPVSFFPCCFFTAVYFDGFIFLPAFVVLSYNFTKFYKFYVLKHHDCTFCSSTIQTLLFVSAFVQDAYRCIEGHSHECMPEALVAPPSLFLFSASIRERSDFPISKVTRSSLSPYKTRKTLLTPEKLPKDEY